MPLRHERIGVLRTDFEQLGPKVLHIDAFGLAGFHRDAKLQHTRALQQPHQVGRIIKAGSLGLVGVEGGDRVLQYHLQMRVLVDDDLQRRVTGRGVAQGGSAVVAKHFTLSISLHLTQTRKLQRTDDAAAVEVQRKGFVKQFLVLDLGVSQLELHGADRDLVVTGGLSRLQLSLEASLNVPCILQIENQLPAVAVVIATEPLDRNPVGQGFFEFRLIDLGFGDETFQRRFIGLRQLLDLFIGQRHHDFDAVRPQGGHGDVKHALRVDSIVEDADGLVEDFGSIRTVGHSDRVDETDATAEVATEANLLIRGKGCPEATTDEHEDEEELPKEILHGEVRVPV